MAAEYYLIEKSTAENIWAAIKGRYTATGQTLTDATGAQIADRIENIEATSVTPGNPLNPITINGVTVNTVWVGAYSSLPVIRDTNTLYIVTS